MKKLLAMLIALGMLISACAVCEQTQATAAEPVQAQNEATVSEPADTNPVLARLREREIRLAEVQSYAQQLYAEGMIQSAADYAATLDYLLIYNALPRAIVAEKGAENLLGAERLAELYEEAAQMYQREIENYITMSFGADLSEEDFAEMYDIVVNAYAESGYPLEVFQEDYVVGEAFGAYFDTFTFDVTDEEMTDMFNDFVEADKQTFEGNTMLYEYATNYYGYSSYYIPSGYRGITHILIDADADALSAYAAACEGTDEAAVEAAKKAVIESCREKLDEIYARFEAGESFESLIAEYNTDPGMSGDNLVNGYSVRKDTVVFMQEFTDGAFSEKMQAVGDVSDPVVTSYGVHILYYLRDVPGGAVEMTDAVRQEMKSYVVYTKQDALLRQWLNEYGVEYTAAGSELMG